MAVQSLLHSAGVRLLKPPNSQNKYWRTSVSSVAALIILILNYNLCSYVEVSHKLLFTAQNVNTSSRGKERPCVGDLCLYVFTDDGHVSSHGLFPVPQ